MLAEKYGVAIVIVAHRRKSPGHTADEMAMGSVAYTGIARAVWHLSKDPKNKARRLFLPGKQNLSAENTGLAFSITGEPVPKIMWEEAPLTMDADEALAHERSSSG